MLESLFQAIDNKDPVKFSEFLTEDCKFKFGNLPVVNGIRYIQEFVSGFFDSIKDLSHEIYEHWEVPGGLICHGVVTYTRKDGSQLIIPFANILKTESGKIYDYSIFVDASELYK